jgi:cation-transporting ATPase 13A1
MRKILFATERVTSSNSSETFYFIGVLVVFAVLAAGSVLLGGLRDEKRNKFRLVLHCIMIVTSVVPPELPMELSLAVRNDRLDCVGNLNSVVGDQFSGGA